MYAIAPITVTIHPSWRAGHTEFRLNGVANHPGLPDTLWFDIRPALTPDSRALTSVAAIALTQLAMHLRQDLIIEGALCPRLNEGIEDFQDAWSTWLPHTFARVRIEGTEAPEAWAPPAPDQHRGPAVLAFSGGLDSSTALALHASGRLGARGRTLTHAVMLHGMDIPLDQADVFERAAERARRQIAGTGTELVTVRTNWKEFCPDWEMGFACGFIAALHLVATATGARTAVLADDLAYITCYYPWGSNYVTNPMLGTRAVEVVGCGRSLTRIDRAGVVADHRHLADGLRVCWQGEDLSSNCGECAKCVITKLCFLAAVGDVPRCLSELRIEQIEALRIEARGDLFLMKQLHQRRAALPHDVADAIEAVWDRETFRRADTGGFPESVMQSQLIVHGYGQALERCRDDAQEAQRVLDAVIGQRRVRMLTRLLGPLDRVRQGR